MTSHVHDLPSRAEAIRPPPGPSPLLTAKFTALRRKVVWTRALVGLSVAVLVGVEVLALAMFLDWWLELPKVVRAAVLLGLVLLVGWLLFRHVLTPFRDRPSDDDLALAIEKARPQLRTRLIATVQLTRAEALPPHLAAGLVDALVEETEAIAAGIDFNSIVPTERVRAIAMAAACVLGVGLAALVYARPASIHLLQRAALQEAPIPRKTRVLLPQGPQLVGRGDDVRIEALAAGLVPEKGWLEVRAAGRPEQCYLMERKDNSFSRTLENVQDSFTYSVRLNDGRSAWFAVKVVPRPAVLSLACEQRFPAYTGLPPRTPPPTDLSLLAGSVLTVNVVPTHDIAEASLKLIGLATNLPLQNVSARELRGRFQVPSHGINGLSISLRDTAGMYSSDPTVYRVDILPDKPPAVRIIWPTRREELFTRQATAIIGMDVADDFQISRLRLRYKLDGAVDAAASAIDLETGVSPKSLQRRFEWNLRTLPAALGAGSRLEFWLEAEDNNNVTGPGLGSSERHFARLVTDEEKRADLWNRASDTLGSINDLASDQDKLNQTLGALIREKAAAP